MDIPTRGRYLPWYIHRELRRNRKSSDWVPVETEMPGVMMIHYLRALVARFRVLFGDKKADWEIHDEIQMHLDLLIQRYIRQGMTRDEAAAAARRQFGNVTMLKEANREMRGIRFIETIFQDIRYGFRCLRRSPMF